MTQSTIAIFRRRSSLFSIILLMSTFVFGNSMSNNDIANKGMKANPEGNSAFPSFLSIEDGRQQLAYHFVEGESPGVLFCSGLQSSMSGTKAIAVENYCRSRGLAFCRFDYRGHGESSGTFEDCTLTDWIADSCVILETFLAKHSKVVIVGSSMGSWIACHVTLRYTTKIVGIVGIASAPDFLMDMYDEASQEEKDEWDLGGIVYQPSKYRSAPYAFSGKLMQDAKKNWGILSPPDGEAKLPIFCKVRLLHGLNDGDISWKKSVDLAERLASTDVDITLIKGGDHRLSDTCNLLRILSALEDVLGES